MRSADFAVTGVRLSVTFVYCIQMAEDIVKCLSLPVSPIILVFDPKRRCLIPRGTPSAGRTRVGKRCDFRLKLPSFSETVRDSPLVVMER